VAAIDPDPPDPHTHARSSDPHTSHAAAARLQRAVVHRLMIMDALKVIGSGTFEEIAEAAGMRDSQVWRRLPDLHDLGVAMPTGKERIGKSRRAQRIWTLGRCPHLHCGRGDKDADA